MWCVSHHDDVPDYLERIDQAFARLSHKFVVVDGHARGGGAAPAGAEAALQMSEDDVLLNPIGNVPLKLAVARLAELPRIAEAGWKPPPRLSRAQRDIDGQGALVAAQLLAGTIGILARQEAAE